MKEEFPEGWEKISKIFSGQPAPDHTEFFVERVMEQVRRPEPVRSPSRTGWWWVPALAPALALLLMLAAVGTPSVVSTQMLLESGSSGWVANTRLSAGGLLELMEEGS